MIVLPEKEIHYFDQSFFFFFFFFLQLSFLMGLPWLLQFSDKPSLALEYIHTILNTLQGFFVFLVLVVTSRVRRMWIVKMFKPKDSSAGSSKKNIALGSSSKEQKNSTNAHTTSV